MNSFLLGAYRAHLKDTGPVSSVIEDTDSDQAASFHNLKALKSLPGDAFMKGLPGFQHRHSLQFSGASIRQEMML